MTPPHPVMIYRIPSRAIPWMAAVLAAIFLTPVMAKPSSKRAKKEQHPQLRIICASSLAETQPVVLASRDAEGKWQELATVELRSPLVTDWLPARAGEMHLALREEGTLKSICKFDHPANLRRALVVLVANQDNKSYEAHVVDPASKGFDRGSMLIFNFSQHVGLVFLGLKVFSLPMFGDFE